MKKITIGLTICLFIHMGAVLLSTPTSIYTPPLSSVLDVGNTASVTTGAPAMQITQAGTVAGGTALTLIQNGFAPSLEFTHTGTGGHSVIELDNVSGGKSIKVTHDTADDAISVSLTDGEGIVVNGGVGTGIDDDLFQGNSNTTGEVFYVQKDGDLFASKSITTASYKGTTSISGLANSIPLETDAVVCTRDTTSSAGAICSFASPALGTNTQLFVMHPSDGAVTTGSFTAQTSEGGAAGYNTHLTLGASYASDGAKHRHYGGLLTLRQGGVPYAQFATTGITLGGSMDLHSTFTGEVWAEDGVTVTIATQPTCAAAQRGKFLAVQIGPGEADMLRLCAKNAANTYQWATVSLVF